MGLTNQGRIFIAGGIIGIDPNQDPSAPVLFDEANAAIGVGDTNTAYSAADTDLKGAVYGTNKDKQGMETGYPTIASNAITFRSLFPTDQANYAWEEWGVFNFTAETVPSAAAGEYMLNRLNESLGSKTAAQSWQITVELTVSTV